MSELRMQRNHLMSHVCLMDRRLAKTSALTGEDADPGRG